MNDLNRHDYSEAINWVATMHDNQYRKGTQIPYVSHVYGVAFSLVSAGIEDRDIIIAALLHDTVEDTEVTISVINEMFGERVAEYVEALSEDKTKSWEDRKRYAINHTKHLPIGAKWIKLADKVNSLEMMATEVMNGTMDWNKFNRGFLHQKWYYSQILSELGKDQIIKTSKLYEHAIELLAVVFGDDEDLFADATTLIGWNA